MQPNHEKLFSNFIFLFFFYSFFTKFNSVRVDIDGEAAGDQSGYSVSLSSDGRIMAFGAPSNDENGDNSGHVRVY